MKVNSGDRVYGRKWLKRKKKKKRRFTNPGLISTGLMYVVWEVGQP